MLRRILQLSGILVVTAFISSPSYCANILLDSRLTEQNRVTLTHVRAYLLIGNLPKASERFQTIIKPELNPDAMLVLAELRANTGDAIGAQQAFLFAINNANTNVQNFPPSIVNYLCLNKKWQALQAFATNISHDVPMSLPYSTQIGQIGLCLFYARKWDEAKYWLSLLENEQIIDPVVYLALARINIEDKQYSIARQLIKQFEAKKNNVDPNILWTSIEVYTALQETKTTKQLGKSLNLLFPNSDQARLYQTMAKFEQADTKALHSKSQSNQISHNTNPIGHSIKKGETLYQLSKRYGLTLADLLKWNPNLVIEDIAIGTVILISPKQ